MAYQKYYGYQYETSPRKLEPEYKPKKNPYKNKKSTAKVKDKNNKKTVKANNKMQKFKITLCVAAGFVVLFSISYRDSLITESFNEKEKLKEELATIQKENEQLKVNIESSLNLNNVEQQAKELLGMQKLDNSQKVYISLSKKDYIETATETVDMEEKLSIWQKILKGLTQSVK
jgi:cell division protein FtsL